MIAKSVSYILVKHANKLIKQTSKQSLKHLHLASWESKNLEREEGTNWSNKQTLQHLHLTSWESKSLEREAGVKQTIMCKIRILHLGQTNKLVKQTSKRLFAISSTSSIFRREEPNSRILGQKEASVGARKTNIDGLVICS